MFFAYIFMKTISVFCNVLKPMLKNQSTVFLFCTFYCASCSKTNTTERVSKIMKKGTYGEKPKNPEWLNVKDAMPYFQMSRLTLMKYAKMYNALVYVGRTPRINVPRMNEGLLNSITD